MTSETNWKYEFKDLPKYDEGKENRIYSDRRSRKDYTTDINGTTITNKYTPGETSATVTKIGMTIITKTENDQLTSKLSYIKMEKQQEKRQH